MIDQPQSRRSLLAWLGAGAAASVLAACGSSAKAAAYKVNLTDAQWRKRLTPAQYEILRQQGTEPAFSSPLLKEHRKGTFVCAGCGNDLFASSTKFESGTDGRASGNRCPAPSVPRQTSSSAIRVSKCIAPIAAVTLATFSRTARSRLACVTAWTAWR